MKIADGVFYGSHLLFRAAVARGGVAAARCGEAAACGRATAARNGGAAVVAGLVVAARAVAARGGAAAARGGAAENYYFENWTQYISYPLQGAKGYQMAFTGGSGSATSGHWF